MPVVRWGIRAVIGFLLCAVVATSFVMRTASTQSAEPLGGLLFDASFFSPILGRVEPHRVYLPPGYWTTDRRYPVVYMLHGAGGNYTEWSDSYLPQAT